MIYKQMNYLIVKTRESWIDYCKDAIGKKSVLCWMMKSDLKENYVSYLVKLFIENRDVEYDSCSYCATVSLMNFVCKWIALCVQLKNKKRLHEKSKCVVIELVNWKELDK